MYRYDLYALSAAPSHAAPRLKAQRDQRGEDYAGASHEGEVKLVADWLADQTVNLAQASKRVGAFAPPKSRLRN